MASTTLDSHFGFVSAVEVWDDPSGFTLRVATSDRTGYCFSTRTKFKVKTHSGREFVVHTDDLRSVVLDHPLCMGLDMNTVVSKLEDLNITDKATRREHIRILQTAHAKGNWASAESSLRCNG